MDVLVGVDLGTTACKVTVVDGDMGIRSVSSAPYAISAPQRGWAEQDPAAWGTTVDATVLQALAEVGVTSGDQVSISLTGQMHSTVLLDDAGEPLRPSILWCDRRATAESALVDERVPDVEAITGNPPLPAFTLPHLLWVREHEPEVFARAATVLVPKDFLRRRWTGTTMTDWTDASGTGMLDAATREWSTTILDALGLDPALLPPVVDPVSDGGDVLTSPGPALAGAHTAVGVGDQFAEALSAGLTRPGDLSITLGTSAVVLGIADRPVPGAFCHAQSDTWMRLDSLHAGGKSLEWLRDMMSPGESVAAFAELAGTAPAGSHDLLFLPFLMGERVARGGGAPGSFVGLTTEHTRGDLVRAVLEGVAFELRRLQESRGTTLPEDVITLKGGGARSALWCRTISAVFGVPYRTTDRDAAYGAAMTAGISRRWWPDWQSVPGLHGTGDDSALVDAPLLDERYRAYSAMVTTLTARAEETR